MRYPRCFSDIIRGCQKRFPGVKLDEDRILNSISIVSPQTLDDLQSAIKKLKNLLFMGSEIRVVIIDSLSLPVQCCLTDGSQRSQFYFRIFDELQKITTEYNVAVLVVNEFRSQIESKGEIVYASAGGQLVAHRAHKRLVLARLSDSTFAAKILKASTIPQISIMFQITEDGIRAADSKDSHHSS